MARARVENAIEYGNPSSWWIEYPDGLIDLSRSKHLSDVNNDASLPSNIKVSDVIKDPPEKKEGQIDVEVDGDRRIRIDSKKSVLVVIDMQK